MTRIHGHAITKSPRLMGGPDEVRLPCAGNPEPFDVLIDHSRGPGALIAHKEATAMCAACPIRAKCHADNADEQWVKLIRYGLPSFVSPQRKAELDQRHALRLETLRLLAAEGTTTARAADWFGIREKHLYQWCRRHGHLDLWHRIAGTQPGRHPKRKEVAA